MDAFPITFWMVQHIALTALLALVVAATCRLLKPSPSTTHLLWLVVLGRLLLPSFLTWPWQIPVASFLETHAATPTSEITSPQASASALGRPEKNALLVEALLVESFENSTSSEWNDQAASVPTGAIEMVPATTPVDHVRSQTQEAFAHLRFELIVMAFWIGGSGFLIGFIVFRVWRLRKSIRRASELPDWLGQDVRSMSRTLGVHSPRCIATDSVRSPFLLCLGKPVLIWPVSAAGEDQRERSKPLIAHELAHLKRRDHWTVWAEVLGLVVWWWNPVFWLVRRELRASAELACDAWVTHHFPHQRRDFAESLVEFAREPDSHQLTFGAVGASSGSRRLFARRLKMIMTENVSPRHSLGGLALGISLVLLSVPAFALDDRNDEPLGDDTVLASAPEPLVQDGQLPKDSTPDDPKVRQKTERNFIVQSTPNNLAQSNQFTFSENQKGATIDEVLSRIEKQYFGEVDRNELEAAAIAAVMAKLDERSSVLSRREFEDLTVSVEGQLVGVGIVLDMDEELNLPIIKQPIHRSPGHQAGIRSGDVIESVDGKSLQGQSLVDVVKQIRGPQGSVLKLGLKRGDEKIHVDIVRERFELASVHPWSMTNEGEASHWVDRGKKIAYVQISSFASSTLPQLKSTLAKLAADGMRGLVIDLRGCPGGRMGVATEVADLFIDEGLIVTSKSRDGKSDSQIQAEPGDDFEQLSLAVLINGNTASAAEILAAALQDHHRAIMIGEQTFGRGTVQQVFPLRNGGALKLTIAQWLRPNGKSLLRQEGRDHWGVQPDTGMKLALTEAQYSELAEHRSQRLDGKTDSSPADDTQLKRAIDLLNNAG